MSEQIKKEELDWENLQELVPMNLIDSDFPEAVLETIPETPSEILLQETLDSLMAPLPEARLNPQPIPSASDTENFTRLRAEMEAQNAADDAAENEAKAKQESEEEAQRQRLEQWMANARARLEKADEAPTAPGRPPSVRREPSPTMVRRVEMQRTLFSPGESTEETLADNGLQSPPGFEDASGYRTGKIALENVDPLATIIVHRDTFVESKADPKTSKLQSLERRVAQIKQAESGAETMVMMRTIEEPKHLSVKTSIWVMVGLIAVILGFGVFALLQTGYLDSVSDLTPQNAQPTTTQPIPAPAQANLTPVQAKPSALPKPPEINTTESTSATSEPKPVPAPLAVLAKPKPVAALKIKSQLSQPNLVREKNPRTQPSTIKTKPITPEIAAKPEGPPIATLAYAKALANAEASIAGVEVAKPASQNESIQSNVGEIELKAMIKEMLRREAGSVQEIYERYLLANPSLKGDIVIGITVNPSGEILEGAVAASNTEASDFDQELLRMVQNWSLKPFPETRSRYVAIPFHFEPPAP